jgi:plasmid stabilization system protein ParE
LSFSFRIAPRAAREIRKAADWWLANRTAAPTMLEDELETAYALIEELPFAGEAVSHRRHVGLRRVLLGRTHYYLYYAVEEDDGIVEVLSLWHTSRGRRPYL